MTILHIALLCAFVFLCFLLVSAILLQTGKGGGMAGLGGGASDSAFGAHTANVLQKFTMYCVIAFFVLVVILGKTQKGDEGNASVMETFKAPPTTEAVQDNPPSGLAPAPKTATESQSVPPQLPTPPVTE